MEGEKREHWMRLCVEAADGQDSKRLLDHTRVGSPPLPCGAFFFTFRHAGIAHAGALRCPRGTPGTSKMYKKHSALIVLSTFTPQRVQAVLSAFREVCEHL